MATYNIADLFEQVADAVPEWTAIVTEDKSYTYAELEARSNRLADFLRKQGVGAGDHVALHLRNDNEYLEAMLAAYKLRAVPVNINYNYVEGELDYIYNDADIAALIVHREFTPRALPVVNSVPTLKVQVVVDDTTDHATPDGWYDYEAALEAGSAAREFEARSSDDLYIIYTGGTTGMPKGVMWRHEDIFFASLGGGDPDRSKGPITSPDEFIGRLPEWQMASLAAPPFMHAAAQWAALTQMLCGGKLLIPAHGSFDVPAILRLAAAEQAVALTIVGDAMATPIADELEKNPEAYDLSSLFVIASGGAILSPAVKARLMALLPGKMVLDGLGSSETGVMGNKTSGMGEDEPEEPKFQVSESVQVLDEQLQPIAPGSSEVGKLARGGHVPLGYYNAPEKTAETFVEANGQRWALPGDLATVGEDGSVTLLGRGSTSINTGGEKVFPEEVESALKAHAGIYDAVVVGVPDDRFGQAVTAVVQFREGTGLELQEVKDFCRNRLASYKLPRHLVTCDNMKRSPAGKADYPWARKFAVEALELESQAG